MKLLVSIVGVSLFLAATASAQQYLCEVREHGRYNLIASEILVDVAADASSATVVDGILMHYEQSPAQATKVKKKGNVLRVEWRLKQQKVGSANVHYTLIYKANTGKVHVSVSMPSYDNDSTASGTCKLL